MIVSSSNTVVATVPVGSGPFGVAIKPTAPLSDFNAPLAIDDGRHPGFVVTSTFTPGSASTGLNPATEAMTLEMANYTLTLPPGSFHQLWKAGNAPYGYDGTVNGATLGLVLTPLR